MLTFVWIVGGFFLVAALLWVVYIATQHGKDDETGRRSEVATGPATPKRTEGREP